MMKQVVAENSQQSTNINHEFINNQLNLQNGNSEQMRLIPINGSVSTSYEDSSSFG